MHGNFLVGPLTVQVEQIEDIGNPKCKLDADEEGADLASNSNASWKLALSDGTNTFYAFELHKVDELHSISTTHAKSQHYPSKGSKIVMRNVLVRHQILLFRPGCVRFLGGGSSMDHEERMDLDFTQRDVENIIHPSSLPLSSVSLRVPEHVGNSNGNDGSWSMLDDGIQDDILAEIDDAIDLEQVFRTTREDSHARPRQLLDSTKTTTSESIVVEEDDLEFAVADDFLVAENLHHEKPGNVMDVIHLDAPKKDIGQDKTVWQMGVDIESGGAEEHVNDAERESDVHYDPHYDADDYDDHVDMVTDSQPRDDDKDDKDDKYDDIFSIEPVSSPVFEKHDSRIEMKTHQKKKPYRLLDDDDDDDDDDDVIKKETHEAKRETKVESDSVPMTGRIVVAEQWMIRPIDTQVRFTYFEDITNGSFRQSEAIVRIVPVGVVNKKIARGASEGLTLAFDDGTQVLCGRVGMKVLERWMGIDGSELSATDGALISDRMRKSAGFARIRILSGDEEKDTSCEIDEKESHTQVSFEVLDYDSDRESSSMTIQRARNLTHRLGFHC
eukprot:TRINITY_DN918_c0_g1_i13.p2 TRINITY_DN918_c0_g1~~TRINITY_DN918_c0_g1_i13.p2  ORF type:complete len:647 (+),score=182.21 TRINITY_DN918_c0_g1_i13:275-1942(+)